MYWTNIPNVTIPQDKNITLSSILDEGYSPLQKARCLLVSDSRPLRTPVKMYHRSHQLSFNTLIFENEEHFNSCKEYFDAHFKGLPAKDIVGDIPIFRGVRYLTNRERERLQTMPEGYCDALSWNECADVLGDGWTVDVIAHIFSHLPNGKD